MNLTRGRAAAVKPDRPASGHQGPPTGQAASRSDARVPLVAAIFPVPALALSDGVESLDELDATHVLGRLVAELALDPEAERRAVGHRQRLLVHVVRENGLLVGRVLEIDTLVVPVAAFPERIEAVKHHIAGPGLDADLIQQGRQAGGPPHSAVAPRLHAGMAPGPGAGREPTPLRPRARLSTLHSTP